MPGHGGVLWQVLAKISLRIMKSLGHSRTTWPVQIKGLPSNHVALRHVQRGRSCSLAQMMQAPKSCQRPHNIVRGAREVWHGIEEASVSNATATTLAQESGRGRTICVRKYRKMESGPGVMLANFHHCKADKWITGRPPAILEHMKKRVALHMKENGRAKATWVACSGSEFLRSSPTVTALTALLNWPPGFPCPSGVRVCFFWVLCREWQAMTKRSK